MVSLKAARYGPIRRDSSPGATGRIGHGAWKARGCTGTEALTKVWPGVMWAIPSKYSCFQPSFLGMSRNASHVMGLCWLCMAVGALSDPGCSGCGAKGLHDADDMPGEFGLAALEEVVGAVEDRKRVGVGEGTDEFAEPGGRADVIRAAGQEQLGERAGSQLVEGAGAGEAHRQRNAHDGADVRMGARGLRHHARAERVAGGDERLACQFVTAEQEGEGR